MTTPGKRAFSPFILPGATWRGRLLACLGAAAAICVTGYLSALASGHDGHLPAIAGPIGASALLLFVIPASPLAQPWPIIAGNTLSAAIGVVTAFLVPEPPVAIGAALGLAIAAMSFTRSLHPPGAAMALSAAMLGPPANAAGWLFPLMPVLANSVLLAALGWLFHRISGHGWPHYAPAQPPMAATRIEPSDIDAALAETGETFDIGRDDLEMLIRKAEARAAVRTGRS